LGLKAIAKKMSPLMTGFYEKKLLIQNSIILRSNLFLYNFTNNLYQRWL